MSPKTLRTQTRQYKRNRIAHGKFWRYLHNVHSTWFIFRAPYLYNLCKALPIMLVAFGPKTSNNSENVKWLLDEQFDQYLLHQIATGSCLPVYAAYFIIHGKAIGWNLIWWCFITYKLISDELKWAVKDSSPVAIIAYSIAYAWISFLSSFLIQIYCIC